MPSDPVKPLCGLPCKGSLGTSHGSYPFPRISKWCTNKKRAPDCQAPLLAEQNENSLELTSPCASLSSSIQAPKIAVRSCFTPRPRPPNAETFPAEHPGRPASAGTARGLFPDCEQKMVLVPSASGAMPPDVFERWLGRTCTAWAFLKPLSATNICCATRKNKFGRPL